MIDISTHTFKTNEKGLLALVLLSITVIAAFVAFIVVAGGPMLAAAKEDIFEAKLGLFVMSGLGCYVISVLYRAWRTYLYAADTTLTIDLKTNTLTYRHNRQEVVFKPSDIAHWYGDQIYVRNGKVSRYKLSHAYIVLKSGEELYLYAWLFEGNHYLRYQYSAPYFIDAHPDLHFPTAETTPLFKFVFPPKES